MIGLIGGLSIAALTVVIPAVGPVMAVILMRWI